MRLNADSPTASDGPVGVAQYDCGTGLGSVAHTTSMGGTALPIPLTLPLPLPSGHSQQQGTHPSYVSSLPVGQLVIIVPDISTFG